MPTSRIAIISRDVATGRSIKRRDGFKARPSAGSASRRRIGRGRLSVPVLTTLALLRIALRGFRWRAIAVVGCGLGGVRLGRPAGGAASAIAHADFGALA